MLVEEMEGHTQGMPLHLDKGVDGRYPLTEECGNPDKAIVANGSGLDCLPTRHGHGHRCKASGRGIYVLDGGSRTEEHRSLVQVDEFRILNYSVRHFGR